MSAADIAKNTKKLEENMAKALLAGVVEGAMVIRREAQKLAPVAFGNLRNSAYVTWSGGTEDKPSFKGPQAAGMSADHDNVVAAQKAGATGKQPRAVVGFSAVYALSVHENPRAGAGKGTEEIVKAQATRAKKSKASNAAKWRARGVAITGQWKFLSTAMARNSKRVKDIIAKAGKKGNTL